eukprot:GHVT01045777.1.p3 GENE.GHVT01045777.1~~GHVT01045777.1.p3  ORF type:complete len:100 (+),score=10.51 GHVT01045777.1:1290-1589(+)
MAASVCGRCGWLVAACASVGLTLRKPGGSVGRPFSFERRRRRSRWRRPAWPIGSSTGAHAPRKSGRIPTAFARTLASREPAAFAEMLKAETAETATSTP